MTQPRRILWLAVFVVALVLMPRRLAAQSGTVTDDGFLSNNSTTQKLNLSGQGISLIVAGSSAAVGSVSVGTTTAYIKFQLQSSLPPNAAAANVTKATLKLFLSPSYSPTGAIDIYPVTSAWTESTLNSSLPPTLAATPFASNVPIGNDLSFVVVDVTALVQEWLNGASNGGIANDGIALVAHTSTTYAVFDSKESIVTSHEPRLEIVLANTGPQGPAGPPGLPGANGQPGAPGAPGQAATITVGTVMSVPYTQAPSVMEGGTLTNATLSFLIPQGQPGVQGPQGIPGPIGINNRNAWLSGTAYKTNDAVSYNNSFWLATAADYGVQPPTGNSNWQLLAAGINNRGAWSAANSYNVNDVVFDSPSGSSWLALQAIPANTPNSEPSGTSTSWQLLAAQGAQGPTGATGAQGAQGIQGLMGLQGPPGPMPVGAAITTTANTFTTSQTINGTLILTGAGGGITFADGTTQITASTNGGATGGGTISCSTFEISSSSPIAPAGYTALSQVTAGNVWFTTAPMPTARGSLAAASSGGKIYAIGGVTSKGGIRSFFSTVEVYDPGANSWSTAASMPTPRYDLAAATDAQGNIYAIGGVTPNGTASTVEKYNPATDTWSAVASMPTTRIGFAAAADAQGKIYTIGGADSLGNPLATVEVYDPATNTWSTGASLPLARFNLAAATDATGKIYAIGGATSGASATGLNRVDAYDPATQAWREVFGMPTARASLAATADSTGKIYAIGGEGTSGVPVSTVEAYDPAGGPLGTWSTAASLPTPALALGAAGDAQGKVYAVGIGGPPSGVYQYSPPVTIYTFIKN